MDRWAGVKFCEKTGQNEKKALSGLGLEQPMSKCPRRGQSDPLLLQCDSQKSRKFIGKTTQQHRFRDNQHIFETIH